MVSRSWCGTSFAVQDFVLPQPTEENKVRYGVAQLEVAPDTGRQHVQFYLEFTTGVRMAHVKRIVDDHACHLEKRHGTRDQAREYCRKQDSRAPGAEPYEVGDWEAGGAGTRNDLAAVQAALDAGTPMSQVAQEHFKEWVRYHGAFDRYCLITKPERSWEMEIHVFWGKSGSGKSKRAFDENPGAYWMPPNAQWFDGYVGQSTIVVDDFYGWLPWSFLLRMLDRYPMPLPIKGGFVPMMAKRIVFTSNTHPTNWYQYDEKKHYAALERRITLIEEMN